MKPDEIKKWLTEKEWRLYGVMQQRNIVLQSLAQCRILSESRRAVLEKVKNDLTSENN